MDKTPEQLVREALEAGQPKTWMWDDDGETVVGQLVDGFTAPTKFNPNCPVLTLLMSDGERVNVWLGSRVLENKVREKSPRLGDTIGIQRLEKVTPKDGGNDYWNWNVIVHGVTGGSLSFLAGDGAGDSRDALPAGNNPADETPTGRTYGTGQPPTGDLYEEAEVVSEAAPVRGWE
jgi:hypothetical protein